MQNVELKAGQLVVFSEGSYSDFMYGQAYVALRNVSQDEMLAVASAVHTKNGGSRWGNGLHEKFHAEIIRQGMVACIDLREIHIGNYGVLDLG